MDATLSGGSRLTRMGKPSSYIGPADSAMYVHLWSFCQLFRQIQNNAAILWKRLLQDSCIVLDF
jgi:hypothetical protein